MASAYSETYKTEPVNKPAPVPVKIVIAGGFGVGKTTTVAAISEIAPLTTEAAMTSVSLGVDNRGDVMTKTTTTVAMDFGRVTIDESLILYLFGTPGQDRFGFMWDDLITGSLGAIVLVDSRRLEDCFPAVDYFEHRDIPFVVAVNRFDGTEHHSIQDVREALDLDPSTPVTTTDARDREAVKDTVLLLLDVVLTKAMEKASRPASPFAPPTLPAN
jgi:signal recognition particle receptor subunit beta